MATATTLLRTLTTLPSTPSREELGRNQSAYLNYWNTKEEVHYKNNAWYREFIPWVDVVRTDVWDAKNETLTARDRAETAQNNAVGAWNNIQGYTIPSGTAYSVEQTEELIEAIIWADAENVIIIKE